MRDGDPFTGRWLFRPELSEMTTPAPRRWVQTIECDGDAVSVREEIDFGEGRATTVRVEARFNGKPFPVEGSPAADAIAYTRVDPWTLTGEASKGGKKTISETLTVQAEGELMHMRYTVFFGRRVIAKGVAVFARARGRAAARPETGHRRNRRGRSARQTG